MRLTKNQKAPAFQVEDVYGKSIEFPVPEKKVLLSFMRFAGCPVCNLRVHELLKNSAKLEADHISVILIYESPKASMLEYLKEESFPFSFVSDKENKLYDIYEIESSFFKVMKGLFHGLLSKAMEGKKLYKKDPGMDGSALRMGADFLIDGKGRIIEAYYSQYLGDHLPIEKLF